MAIIMMEVREMDESKRNAIVLKLLQVLAEEKLSNREASDIVGLTYQSLELAKGLLPFSISPDFEALLPR